MDWKAHSPEVFTCYLTIIWQSAIDLLFNVKHRLTRATLHKYLYVHRYDIDCIDTYMSKWDWSHSYAHGTPLIPH